jgi:predicted ATPase
VLVTSRELLGLPYETVRQVRPLRIPGEDDVHDLDRLQRNPSVELFTRRAAQVRAGFAVDRSNARQVVAVCRQLDGLPLALELAAAALRNRGLTWLADRLADPLAELGTIRRGSPGHHRTLRAALLRSIDSLCDDEVRLLARVSTFNGEFGVDLARESLPAGAADVQILLDRLVDTSLVTVRHDPDGSRYRVLRTVRALGRELQRAG